ncbi:MAG: hypothetical protein J0M17_12855, partial [Planctomycetes bacterium]|nr:hypothetical protein [Planctomycetota bacterium]
CKAKSQATADAAPKADCGCHAKPAAEQKPAAAPKPAKKDVREMTQAEKLAYNQAKRDQLFGKF